MKKTVSLLLCAVMILTVLPIFSWAKDASVDVTFYNDLRGSAAGEYSVHLPGSGKYSLFWGNTDGEKLTTVSGERELSYTALVSYDVKNETDRVYSPQPFTAIPYGAEKLLLVSAGKTVASFDLPENKLLEKPQNYAYGVISDLHFEASSNGSDQGIQPVTNAFDFFESTGVTNVFGTGDLATNADKESYQDFANVEAQSNVVFLTCGGNHEVVSGYDRMYADGGIFYQYVNKGVYDGSLEGVLDVAPNKHDFVYGIPGTNDIFVAICQARWDSTMPSMKPLVEPETLDWFEEMLEKYKDKKVHLLMHTFLSDDDYDHVDGEGDISNKAGYGYAYYWNVYSEEDARLRRIFDAHEDMIWFNGHSHWIIEMQKYNENLNIFDYGGTTSTLIHVPSVTSPRTVDDYETSYHSNIGVRSEGLLMFSCDGYEIENAINFKTGEIYAFGCYIVYDRDTAVIKGKTGDAEWTFDRQLSSLRVTGSGAFDPGAEPPYAGYASAVRSLYVSRGVTEIGEGAFENFTALGSVEIKDGLVKIGKSAFENCSAIASLILPETLEAVEDGAFRGAGAKDVSDAVTFGGTPEEFSAITVGKDNGFIRSASAKMRYVTWKIGDYTRIDRIAVGSVPVYGDAAVMPYDVEGKYLPFVGWNNGKRTFPESSDLPKISENATYTASFGNAEDRFIGGEMDSKISWSLDRATGTLYIEGSGTVPSFAAKAERPWEDYAEVIYTAVIKKGIKGVGDNVFSSMKAIRTLIIEEGVKTLGKDCFAYCSALSVLYMPKSVVGISQGTSYSCPKLNEIHFSGNETEWETFQRRAKAIYNEPLQNAKNPVLEDPAPTSSEFTVTFVDDEDQVIASFENVKWGEGVAAPAAPEKNGKTFVGYDGTYFLVTRDLTVRAVYESTGPSAADLLSGLPFNAAAFIVAAALEADALAA